MIGLSLSGKGFSEQSVVIWFEQTENNDMMQADWMSVDDAAVMSAEVADLVLLFLRGEL